MAVPEELGPTEKDRVGVPGTLNEKASELMFLISYIPISILPPKVVVPVEGL